MAEEKIRREEEVCFVWLNNRMSHVMNTVDDTFAV